MIFGILKTLKKSSSFVGIKTFEVLAYIYRIFTKNVNNFDILRQIFLLLQQIVLYLQFEVNCDHTTRSTKCWSNETLKCYAKKFVIVDRQAEED